MTRISLFDRVTAPKQVFNTYLGNGQPTKPEYATRLAPAVGYKKVWLRVNDLGKVELVAPTFETVIPLISRAECHKPDGALDHLRESKNQVSIGGNCTCGYYSFKEPEPAFRYHAKWILNTVAEVVNSGYYVEHDEGYRAERIRVTRLLTQYCSKCAPEHKNPAITFNKTSESYLMPLCADHSALWRRSEWRADQILDKFMRPVNMTHDIQIESILPDVELRHQEQITAPPEPENVKTGFWRNLFS